MMLGAFLIGYITARFFARIQFKKIVAKLKEKVETQQEVINTLKSASKENLKATYKQDRMDQEYEQQIQFQKRAFSEDVIDKSVSDIPAINFDTIGIAKVDDKDDLQQIVGIGPYTEAKLNNLGIYTFRQISRFNEEDINIVTDLIKFFPDRIKNDRWVSKAKELSQQQSKDKDSKPPSTTNENPEEDSRKKETKVL